MAGAPRFADLTEPDGESLGESAPAVPAVAALRY